MGGKEEVVFTALQKKSWPTLTSPCTVSCAQVSRHSYSWLLLSLFTMSMEKSTF